MRPIIDFLSNRQLRRPAVALSGFFSLLFCYHLMMSNFFPNVQGGLGHDYSGLLPGLLDGYYWFRNNSLFDTPWFTPSFCGGQPFFADVQSNYYSIVQRLTMVMNPLLSAYVSIMLFATFGFWGMYFLLRRVFATSGSAAFLAASLFMFNGFYAHRMMVGHFGNPGFMLAPWVALLLLDAGSERGECVLLPSLLKTVSAGFLVAYWLQAGLTTLIIPVSLSVLAVVCVHFYRSTGWPAFLCRSAGAALVALGLSASKLTVGLAFMSNFERSDYLLPGVNGIFNAVKLLFITLFWSPANIEEIALPQLSNLQWALNRHEWEYGVSCIPLLIIVVAWAYGLWSLAGSRLAGLKDFRWRSLIPLAVLAVILIIPLAINVYTPEWNAVLKRTPLLKSSSTLFRWWIIYIPVTIVYAALSLERLTFVERFRPYFVAASVIVLVWLNLGQEREYYDTQGYEASAIMEGYARVALDNEQPKISEIGLSEIGNDAIAFGVSQLGCYNPSFGYQLEKLPIKGLHPGSIFEESDGYLNLKNPACYVFPAENNCQPGDHFTVAQKEQAELFASYRPFPFVMPLRQKVANIITLTTLIAGSLFLVGSAGYLTLRKFRP